MNNDGLAKARETAQKIKSEVAEKNAAETENRQVALQQLDALKGNEALAKLYQESAGVGAENLQGELPQLKIHTANKSQGNELLDGSEPSDGWFFLKSEGKQYKEVLCHIVYISEGFRAEGMDDKKDVFNQIISGVINDEGDYKPFMMYLTGSKLRNFFAFQKDLARYTKGRMRLPVFALTVKLTTEKIEHSYGKSWVTKFDIQKDDKGMPLIVTDEGLFVFLKDAREQASEMITNLVAATRTDKGQTEVINASEDVAEASTEAEIVDAGGEDQDISPEEIPF